jgi:hypothetical protein
MRSIIFLFNFLYELSDDALCSDLPRVIVWKTTSAAYSGNSHSQHCSTVHLMLSSRTFGASLPEATISDGWQSLTVDKQSLRPNEVSSAL